MDDHRYDFIIAGSGAGGASLARDLARKGKEVLILERGIWEQKIGTFNDAVRFYDSNKLTRIPKKSLESTILFHAFMAGGTTNVSCGNASRTLEAPFRERGIDLAGVFSEVEAELNVQPTPEEKLSVGSQRMRQAAQELGYTLRSMPKFVDFERCSSCGLCGFGCVPGAKWTALKPLQEALEHGAQIRYQTKAERVLIKNGNAVGVECNENGRPARYNGRVIVLAAGGLNTPVILKNSGIEEAGRGLFIDLLVNVYGRTDGLNQLKEPLMALLLDELHEEQGFILSTYLNSPRPVRLIEAGPAGVLLNPKKMIGLMVKTSDDRSGVVYRDASVSKVPSVADRKRLKSGVDLATQILIRAGADAKSILVTQPQGAHPGGTAALGEVVDTNLQTRVENLFVCDASVMPETPGLPPILTILALARYLARKLG